jgi:hypothetical protein
MPRRNCAWITPEDLDILEEYGGITKRALTREQK